MQTPVRTESDPCFCVGPRALQKWIEVKPGFSAWFRLKLGLCFSLRSFYFPHDPHISLQRWRISVRLGTCLYLVWPTADRLLAACQLSSLRRGERLSPPDRMTKAYRTRSNSPATGGR